MPFKPLALIIAIAAAQPLMAQSITPEDYLPFVPEQAALGRVLFYDKILSGNRNISCGTCHHHDLHSSDGLSLGIGEGGAGIGPQRHAIEPIEARIPRNAPALWNLGHREVTRLFHDGRVETAPDGRFRSPAGVLLPEGLNSLLAAQALFPLSSSVEMAGMPMENTAAAGFAQRIDLGWEVLTARVRSVPGYHAMFTQSFDHVTRPEDITITEIANALDAFIGTQWQSHDSPWDDYLNHGTPLPNLAERGRVLFFGEAGCAACHNGPLLSDQGFHAIGLPQFGPGRPFAGNDGPRDLGRMEVSGDKSDAYRFRTPSLRNVALSAPYGHNGAYDTLRDMIHHMCDPITARANWTPEKAHLPQITGIEADFALIGNDKEDARIMAALDIIPVHMRDEDIDAIEAFLHSLTGKSATTRPMGRPKTVPSGLPVN